MVSRERSYQGFLPDVHEEVRHCLRGQNILCCTYDDPQGMVSVERSCQGPSSQICMRRRAPT